MEKNKKIIKLSLIVVGLLLLLSGSFAYFVAKIQGNKTNISGTGTLNFDINLVTENDGYINASNFIPITSKEIDTKAVSTKFQVKTGNNENYILYDLQLSDVLITSNLISGDFKWDLICLNDKNKSISGTFETISPNTLNDDSEEEKTSIVLNQNIKIARNSIDSYELRIYILESAGDQSELMNGSFSGKVFLEGTMIYDPINEQENIFGNDISGANAPVLADNMIPVYYDETSDTWKKTSNMQTAWYNYNDQIWANAVTVKSVSNTNTTLNEAACTGTDGYCSRNDYKNSTDGTVIPMTDILGMWVWIPRYQYKIDNPGTTMTAEEIHVKFISDRSEISASDYLIHPAFRNGATSYRLPNGETASNYSQGGWSFETKGFWYGKFESGMKNNHTADGTISSGVLVKPDVYAIHYISMSNAYNSLQSSFQNEHGIGSALESHMSKNDEWGAVAYLSNSQYGKFGNTDYGSITVKEVYPNNCYTTANSKAVIYTGRSAGIQAGGTNSGYNATGTYKYNNCLGNSDSCTETDRNTTYKNLGTGASTTGNIYGVYDMVAGSYEFLMGNLLDNVASSIFSSVPEAKYCNKYTTTAFTSLCNGSPCYGVGWTNETGNGSSGTAGWYSDSMYLMYGSTTWVARGFSSVSSGGVTAGIFLNAGNNGSAQNLYGYRAVLSESQIS